MVPTNSLFFGVAALLLLNIFVGGAGVTYPLLQLLLELAGLGMMAFFVIRPRRSLVQLGRPVLILVAAVVGLGILQLLPLPPAVWKNLPGRDSVIELDSILGWTVWRPLTLDPERTIRALILLIPTIAMLLGCMRLPLNERVKLLWVAAAGGILSALVGISQFATHGGFTPYPSAHSGFPIGFFVNRNHQAAFLLSLMPVVGFLASQVRRATMGRRATLAIALCALVVLSIVIVATTSRMALALLPFVLTASLAVMFAGESVIKGVAPAVAIIGSVFAIIVVRGGLSPNLARFSSLNDARFSYWTDVRWALGHYGLAGTGFGTFIPVQKTAESLSTVTPAIVNHAHNDYLELLLDGGVPVLLLIASFAAILGLALFRLRSAPPERQRLGAAAFAGMAAILAFSSVDYPLRMPAVAAVFAVLFSLLLRGNSGQPRLAEDNRPVFLDQSARWIALTALAGLTIVVVQAGVSGNLLLLDRTKLAARWAPWSTEAISRNASKQLFVDKNATQGCRSALAALRLSPIDAPSIRTAAVCATLRSDPKAGEELLRLAASLGWRDAITNVLVIRAAIALHDPVTAVERLEATYRQHQPLPVLTGELLSSPIGGAAASALVAKLKSGPDWRWLFLTSAARVNPQDLPAVEFSFSCPEQNIETGDCRRGQAVTREAQRARAANGASAALAVASAVGAGLERRL